MKKIFYIILLLSAIQSCLSENDICSSGEATPRMKIKFKTFSTGKVRSMDSIFISVDFGNGFIDVIQRKTKTDSVMIPLRVDNSPFTEISVKTSQNGSTSKVRLNYESEIKYVSPACGVKKLYKNLNSNLISSTPVLGVETALTEITNEDKTHLFLMF